MRRDDHEKKCYFRSPERVIRMNGSWYFATREGDEGPYPSEVQAQMESVRFVTERTSLANFQLKREAARASIERIELTLPEDRPRLRPCAPLLAKHEVYI